MKTMKKVGGRFFQSVAIRLPCAFIVASFLFWANDGRAQSFQVSSVQPISEVQPAESDSVVAVAADAYGLSQTSLESLPVIGGTFWIVESNGVIPPFPFLPVQYWNCHAWEMADGIYLVDATGGQVPILPFRLAREAMTANALQSAQLAVEAQGNAVANLIGQVQDAEFMQAAAAMFGFDMRMLDSGSESSANFAYSFDTNALWLEITNFSNGFSCYNLHNATNLVYAIWTTTNLMMPFAVETELWPTDPNCQPFTLQNNSRQYLFVRAEDWTGVDSNSDGVPDWWAWKYFGTTDAAMTNLDLSNGNTFAQDYSNNVTPTVFKFIGLEVPNNYVSTTTAAIQLDVAGNPYYVATLIDDSNFSNAVWNTYSGSTVTVNLGSSQGWHDVWIGLRVHGAAPNIAVWQRQRIKLDWTTPALVITSQTNGTVAQPMIQLTGFSPETLASISYDLTNALGVVTNQQVLVLNKTYDPNTWEFTTNTFQAFDVPLTNGLNQFTFNAKDLAGNTTTLVTNFTLSYAGKTNPPVMQLLWPTNGMTIAGCNFTVRGVVVDFTATVTASLVDTNGTTNIFSGVVERSGNFWLENLPLSGTNTFSLTITDAAGNVTLTNLTISQSSVMVTLDTPTDPSQLWQPTINLTGTVSDPTATVIINDVTATVDPEDYGTGTYNWSAENVPTSAGGVAVFAMSATPSGSSTPISQQASVDKPWRVFMLSDAQDLTATTDHYSETYENFLGEYVADYDDGSSQNKTQQHYEHAWLTGFGGAGSEYNNWQNDDWDWLGNDSSSAGGLTGNMVCDATGWGEETGTSNDGTTSTSFDNTHWIYDKVGNEHCDVSDPINSKWDNDNSLYDDDNTRGTIHDTYTRTAQTVWHVQTGGKAVPGLLNLCQFSGSATEIVNKRGPSANDKPIPYDQIAIGSMGNLGTNGIRYNLLPNDKDFDITPTVVGKNYYTFSVGGQKYLSHFEVFVDQPWPNWPNDHFDPISDPQPVGYPYFRIGVNGGHAWWRLTTDAPLEAVEIFIASASFVSTKCIQFLGVEVGYGETNGLDWLNIILTGYAPTAPGELPWPNTHSSTIHRSYGIGFPNLISGLSYTEKLHENPGTYDLKNNNCATETGQAGWASGVKLPSDWLPEIFGFNLPLDAP